MELPVLLVLGGAWLLSPVVLLITLLVTRHRLRETLQRLASQRSPVPSALAPVHPAPPGDSRHRLAPIDLDHLLLLRRELERLVTTGELTPERYRDLTAELDRLLDRHLWSGGAEPGSAAWEQRRARAWNLLAQAMDTPPGPAPWLAPTPSSVEAATTRVWEPATPSVPSATAAEAAKPEPGALELEPLELEPLELDESAFQPTTQRTLPVQPRLPRSAATEVFGLSPSEPATATMAEPPANTSPEPVTREPSAWTTAPTRPRRAPARQQPRPARTWHRAEPNALERAFRAVSGWPRLVVPFLLQNIGWFIGAFCFISGALFLIANTSGFTNALVVYGSLVGATAFLLWAGYQFRRKGDSLVVASSMLLTLAMLLAPLDLTVAVGLVDAADGNALLLGVGLGLTALTLAAFALTAGLASGLMDRVLLGGYPRLLTALAAMQLAGPLAELAPHWGVLAALHLMLLGLLAFGLITFSRDWLRRLFVDQRLTTYYAAGILVYTALVSGVQLTWNWPQALPPGYAGPFLMAVCGLLFTLDAAFKEYVGKFTFLSHFSFAIYGLSAVAIAIALPSVWTIDLTLAMGALLYAWITWQYRTLPPLYLLIGCLAGLYGFGILRPLPPAWHELASLPGLMALLGMTRLVAARSRAIALQGLGTGAVLLIGLTGWSLIWPGPDWVGPLTAASAAVLIAYAAGMALRLPDADSRWVLADAVSAALAGLAVALAPAWLPGSWPVQTGTGLLGLAAGWTALALFGSSPWPLRRRIWIGAALTKIALAIGLAVSAYWLGQDSPMASIALIALAAALTLWLSLGLRSQALFYALLALVGGAALLLKRGYFPGPSSGLSEFLAVLALWPWLARLGWRERERQRLQAELTGVDRASDGEVRIAQMIRAPLEQAMALLWVIGLTHLGWRLLDGGSPNIAWVVVPTAMISGLILLGHFHLFRWLALPAAIGLVGLVVELLRLHTALAWIGAGAAGYVLVVWLLGSALLRQPLLRRLASIAGFTEPGGRRLAEESLRGLALMVAAVLAAANPALVFLGIQVPDVVPALLLCLGLFALASDQTRSPPLAFAALATLVLGTWLVGHWFHPVALFALGQPVTNTLLALIFAVVGLRLARDPSGRIGYWLDPLRWSSGLLYLLAIGGAVLGALVANPGLPLLLGALMLALFPVTRHLHAGTQWRGLTLALLLGGLVISLADEGHRDLPVIAWTGLGWGYLLWALANLLVPRWNRRLPGWAVATWLWPLLGLAGVLGGAVLGVMTGSMALALAVGSATPYLFLLMGNTAHPGLAWLAVGALTLSGALAVGLTDWHPRTLALAALWANLLLLGARLWRGLGQPLARRLGWRADALAEPLFWLPFMLLGLIALPLAWFVIGGPGDWFGVGGAANWIALAALLLVAGSMQALALRAEPAQAHLSILALTLLVGVARPYLTLPADTLPLALALWTAALLGLGRWRTDLGACWRAALPPWLIALPAAALGLLMVQPQTDWLVATLTFLVLAGIALAQGWRLSHGLWLAAGLALAMVSAHTLWLVGTGPFVFDTLAGLAPWYGLQAILLWLAMDAVQVRLTRAATSADDTSGADRIRLNRLYDLASALDVVRPWALRLGLAWLAWHVWTLLTYRTGWAEPHWHFGLPTDALAVYAALLALTLRSGLQAWRHRGEDISIYLAALLLGLLAGYTRLVLLGLAPFTVIDTIAIMAAAYLAFLLQQMLGLQPFARLAMVLPLLAIATTPLHLASTWAGGTLVAAGLLNLSLAARMRNPWPTYLGVLALNGAIYLWAPLWAERYGLWQFYIEPAAVSVLALVQLHRHELRPSVLNSTRLAALSLLYAGAGLDLFLRPELSIFVAALGLALVGVILGIALRIRAFLYAGLAFLVLNVAGQLVRFYPDQAMSRALILIGLGAVITGGMVFFNLKREAILRRMRILRADLADWA